MAGTDTFRGIGYQQAQAVHLALDIVEAGLGHSLRVEGMDDIVDLEVLEADGRRLRALQAKTRTGTPWTPALVIGIFDKWLEGDDDGAMFTFVTDSVLGPGAQKFVDALDASRDGNTQGLINLVGAEKAGRLRNSFVRVAPDTVGSLLASADRRAAAFVDPLIRSAGVSEAAMQTVNTLFRVLTERAGLKDPAERIVSEAELREIVGGLAGQPPDSRWPGDLVGDHFDAVLKFPPDLVDLSVRRLEAGAKSAPAFVIGEDCPATLSGATGTGKSSVTRLLQDHAARAGRTVILARAETYIAGRLDALAADSLGFTIGRALPPSTGRQILADSAVTLVIDGASEIPDDTARSLASDLRVLLSRPGMAKIIVVGRSTAALRSLLPSGVRYAEYGVEPLGRDRADEIVCRLLGEAHSEHARRTVLQRADHQLGDGARNPILLTLYVRSLAQSGTAELNRSEVYATFVDELAARAAGTASGALLAVLEETFAHLISQQRRYSDAYEWIQLTDAIADAHPELNVSGLEVREFASRSGITNVLNQSGTVIPFHDSIADYLAARAPSQGMIDLPSRLLTSDEQWVKFATEQRQSMAMEMASLIVRDIPFVAFAASINDKPALSVSEVAASTSALLQVLLDTDLSVMFRELPDGRRAAMTRTGRSTVVLDPDDGPLAAAVRLWRLDLRGRLKPPPSSRVQRPTDADAARAAVQLVAKERQRAIRDCIALFPGMQSRALTDEIGPTGVHARVGDAVDNFGARDWTLTYWPAPDVHVTVEADPSVGNDDGGHTTVMNYCSGGGGRAAMETVRSAIESLVGRKGWLS